MLAKRPCFLENCYYETWKTIQPRDVIMKHAGTRRENTVPNFAYRETTLGRNIGKAFAIRDTSALYIRGIYVFTLFLVKKFDDSLTKKRKGKKGRRK